MAHIHVHLQSDGEAAQPFIRCARCIRICVYACLCVCLRHVLECKCVVANVLCLCLDRPVNTHVECQLFLQWECVTIYVKLKALAVG